MLDLQRQQSRWRWRAERKLRGIGAPAVPFLVPLATAENELTRTIVMRFFSQYATDDIEIIDACINALLDENVYVRDYAAQSLRKLTKHNFGFRPDASSKARARDEKSWTIWWRVEKARREAEAENGEKSDKES